MRQMSLKVIGNDITKVSADTIVNAANPKLVYASSMDFWRFHDKKIEFAIF